MASSTEGKVIVRAFPVLVACQGCAEFGAAARDVALLLDRRGYGELAWLGAKAAELATIRTKARARFPVFCLDACGKGCARTWLAGEGVTPQRELVLSAGERSDSDCAARRIASDA
jgi:uncharacterized metal-binding protein